MTVRVQEAAFDVTAELAALTGARTHIGGVGMFLGLVRDTAERPLRALHLEHYPGMTEARLAEIRARAMARWPLDGATIIHRVGRLEPGEPIVLVLTTSAHREAALDACAFLIDYLKTEAPFWKREEFADGERWVEAKSADTQAKARWG